MAVHPTHSALHVHLFPTPSLLSQRARVYDRLWRLSPAFHRIQLHPDQRRPTHHNFRDQKVPACSLPLVERIKWAIKLSSNTRCTGWSHGPKHVLPPPPLPSTTRINFVLQQIGTLVLDLIFYDIIITYVRSTPNFARNGPSFAEGGIIRRTTNVLVLGLAGSTSIRACHRICRILSLCIGMTEPQDCPPLFGDIRDAYTLRGFWGRTWHQMLRWPAISHGRFLAYDVFRLKRGSKLALLVQVYTAFLVTGLIHLAAEYSVIGYWTYRHTLLFFLLQPVGITFEFLVIDEIVRKFAIRGLLRRFLGHLWVVMWFVYTVPNFIDPPLRKGIAEAAPSLGIVSTFLGS